MEQFKVINIIDGDTFDVAPGWSWNNQTGSRVRPVGYDAPEMNTTAGKAAKGKLERLALGKTVQLGSAYRIDRGRLVCEVFLNGNNLKNYFPGYQ